MRSVYTNRPINKPVRRRQPALKTLAVMSVVLAMMFGVKLFYDPHLPGADEASAVGALPQSDDSAQKTSGDAIMVNALPAEDTGEEDTTAAEDSGNG